MARPASPRRYQRADRLNELLREVIADELERIGDDDPRLRMVAITGVETAAELVDAKVYFSTLDDPVAVAAALEAVRFRLQKAIGRQITARRTPVLSFLPDRGVLDGRRIDELLNEHPPQQDEVRVDPSVYKDGTELG
jgi:ribosome-binding factor A